MESFEPYAVSLLRELQAVYTSGRTRSVEWRRKQLDALWRFLVERESDILAALAADVGKPEHEAWFTEVSYLRHEISYALRHLEKWVRPRHVWTPLVYQPASSYVVPEPCGVVLVLSAWNYPMQLALAPVIAAIAAGNCLVLKPSEQAPVTSTLLATALPAYLDRDTVRVVEGGADVAATLVSQPFDHIFYTGSRDVGRKVLQAAAGHLVPVTLELGGKNPCIVDKGADPEVAARRIAWAKFINAGQTCIAPDYVLVHREIEALFLEALKVALQGMYGPDASLSPEYGRVSSCDAERMGALMEGCRIVTGGQVDTNSGYVDPTVLSGVSVASPVMREEIFGPLLPVIPFSSPQEAVTIAAEDPSPLALYLFPGSRQLEQYYMQHIRSGGVGINDLLFQAAIPSLPFGGIGHSGMGRYHGKAGFDIFSHERSVHKKGVFPENRLRYPPMGAFRFRLLQALFGLWK